MIVYRYLAREVLVSMLAVSSVLLVIIMSGRFVKYLSKAAVGELDPGVLFSIMLYRLPGFLELILPLGLFLGFLLGYGRLYLESEMTVLEATGMSQKRLVAYSMGPALMVAVIVGTLSVFISPLGASETNNIFDQQENRSELESLTPGRFQKQKNSPRVTYTDSLDESGQLGMIFMADRNKSNDRLQITLAQTGTTFIDQSRDQRFLVLEKGYRYEGVPGQGDYVELGFERYGSEIEHKNQEIRFDKVEALPTSYLWASDEPRHQAQLNWRLSLPVLAIVVTLLAVPLSRVNPRQGRFARLVPSILIYLTYLAVLSNITSKVGDGEASPWAIWLIHLIFGLGALNMIVFGRFWSRLFDQIPMPSLKLSKIKKS
ncbi:LPS export ABC transporter permease LptF [Neptuniibacter sp.]|uniref:LPS export ABC transporter permease LptF n=1 Tax=Neptuniibacter sp. TaxID=1962643 RepID=UPI002619D48D|nr:LPS export ABC transporter permease LptF [Neptuniibacter sp.]MCP4597523.1 LPS export ABC transporter permease LptF [Neptuniibacter sp.]